MKGLKTSAERKEFEAHFERRYLELRQRAKTYGELEEIIDRESKNEIYTDPYYGKLLRVRLEGMLRKEWGDLPIIH